MWAAENEDSGQRGSRLAGVDRGRRELLALRRIDDLVPEAGLVRFGGDGAHRSHAEPTDDAVVSRVARGHDLATLVSLDARGLTEQEEVVGVDALLADHARELLGLEGHRRLKV